MLTPSELMWPLSSRKLVFWEPTVSPHKNELFAALAAGGCFAEVTCFADQVLSRERAALGWSSRQELSGFTTTVSPTSDVIQRFFLENPRALHIFSGIRHFPTIELALRTALSSSCWFGVYSEPRVFSGFFGKCRIAQSILTEKQVRAKVKAVFAIGKHGRRWYQLARYDDRRVFDFGYFRHVNPPFRPPASSVDRKIRAGYVGRLERAKGADLMVGLASLTDEIAEVHLFGSGSLWSDLCRRGALYRNFHLHDAIPMGAVDRAISSLDVLVCPSRSMDDGWSMVVAEALQLGVFVIVTACVGASLLIKEDSDGSVMDTPSASVIASAILRAAAEGHLCGRARAIRRLKFQKMLDVNRAAEHMSSVIRWSIGEQHRPAEFFDT